jgi:protein SCO1/2
MPVGTGARLRAAAVAFSCAVVLQYAGAGAAHAHGAESHSKSAGESAAPAAPVTNRWGANYFPNTTLVTQDGKPVRFYEDLLKDKQVAINVIYTSCKDECPLETARLVQLQRLLGERMGKDIFFYSISIDPVHDTPEVLKAYAAKFGVGPGWLFLTGKPEDIKAVVKKIGLSRGSDSANRDGHTASLMVGDVAAGQWMRNSAVDDPNFLSGTIGNFLGWKNLPQGKSYVDAQPLNINKGQFLFDSRCSACHSLGQGDKVGPDLADVTARRERKWLASYIMTPEKMRAERDPIALGLVEKYPAVLMPNVSLGSVDVADVLSYIETQYIARKEKMAKEQVAKEQAAKDHEHHEHKH